MLRRISDTLTRIDDQMTTVRQWVTTFGVLMVIGIAVLILAWVLGFAVQSTNYLTSP